MMGNYSQKIYIDMEDYVTFEQAQRLRELGFDWRCNHYYRDNEPVVMTDNCYINFNENDEEYETVSAPTLAQAAKWLREKHNLYIHIYLHLDDCWRFEIQDVNDIDKYIFEPEVGLWWRFYEDALSAGIDKVLEHIK